MLKEYPRGLINPRNECYMNVILQSLAASRHVYKWLASRLEASGNGGGGDTPGWNSSSILAWTLSRIIATINRTEFNRNNNSNNNNNKSGSSRRIIQSPRRSTKSPPQSTQTNVWNDNNNVNDEDMNERTTDTVDYDEFYAAERVKRALSAHNWRLQSEEHDCHEFFHLLMDVLDEEQLEHERSNKSLNYFHHMHSKSEPSSSSAAAAPEIDNSHQVQLSEPSLPVSVTAPPSSKNPFHGNLVTQFTCLDCGYKVKSLNHRHQLIHFL